MFGVHPMTIRESLRAVDMPLLHSRMDTPAHIKSMPFKLETGRLPITHKWQQF